MTTTPTSRGSADVDSRWHAAFRERPTMADNPGLPRGPIRYELRLQGHLDQHWSSWFTGLTLTHNPDGTTSLCGTLADQAELHGLLVKVRDLGATLLSVTSVTSAASRPEAQTTRTALTK